jgi:hypothetical protein
MVAHSYNPCSRRRPAWLYREALSPKIQERRKGRREGGREQKERTSNK